MKPTAYLNATTRCCRTCIHRKPDNVLADSEYDEDVLGDVCTRFFEKCKFAIRETFGNVRMCGPELREWRAKPPVLPRRSLRQWFLDTFWA